MRWLGAHNFVILPLLPELRTPDARSDEMEHGIWDGVEIVLKLDIGVH